VLNDELRSFAAKCVGFVVMPDHVHAIIWLPTTGRLSSFMHAWKRKSSFHIRNWYREHAPHYFEGFGEGDRFWLPKYFPFEVYSLRKMEEKLRYMHENPVGAGLVARAVDWPCSSTRWYVEERSVGVRIEWVE
jgi:putative transposase